VGQGQKVKVGIIGTGGIAHHHIRTLKARDDAEVVAACDIRPEALEAAAERWEIPHLFEDYRALLRLKDLDAVSICTPNYFHSKPALAALRAGKHVMVEKPMAMNAREAARMVEAAHKAGKILVVGFQLRYQAEVQMIKRAIDDGLLGRILYARCQALRRRGIPSWGVFGRKELQGGGPMIDIGVHILEVTHYLMGAPRPVAASAACYTYIGDKKPQVVTPWGAWDHKTYTVEDLAVGLIRFEDGSTLSIESSFAAHIERNVRNFVLMGEKGGATYDPPALHTDLSGTMFNLTPSFPGKVDVWERKMGDWIECIRTGRKPVASGEHGLVVQKMLDAMYRSAERGKEVAIP